MRAARIVRTVTYFSPVQVVWAGLFFIINSNFTKKQFSLTCFHWYADLRLIQGSSEDAVIPHTPLDSLISKEQVAYNDFF
ncbi:hypothetical protein YSY43_09240 [Paenibacillus sp. YSY-4.3]